MKIFVTGGAGYIGSHTVLELGRNGHQVLVFDNLTTGNIEAIKRIEYLLDQSFQFVLGDVRDHDKLTEVMCKFRPDAIIHFAALKVVSESCSNPIDYYDVNVNGTISLLKSMEIAKCNVLVFSSSATVYGPPQFLPLSEEHPTDPVSPYGRTKLIVEKLLEDWCVADKLRQAICLRYFNPVGADASGRIGENPAGVPGNIMPFMTDVAFGQRKKLYIFGNDYETRDGTGERDFIHVTDVAICHVRAVERLDTLESFEVMNIGTGVGTTVVELRNIFEKVCNVQIPIELTHRRSGDVASCWTQTDLAQKKLQYKCERTVAQACIDAWSWRSNNPNGY